MKSKVSSLAREGIARFQPRAEAGARNLPRARADDRRHERHRDGRGGHLRSTVCSNAFVSLLRNVIPDRVRIPTFVLIIATLVTIVRMVMEKFLPSIYDALGISICRSSSSTA